MPSFDLDQVNIPDPVAQQLCQLEKRIYANEQKINDYEHNKTDKIDENA